MSPAYNGWFTHICISTFRKEKAAEHFLHRFPPLGNNNNLRCLDGIFFLWIIRERRGLWFYFPISDRMPCHMRHFPKESPSVRWSHVLSPLAANRSGKSSPTLQTMNYVSFSLFPAAGGGGDGLTCLPLAHTILPITCCISQQVTWSWENKFLLE